MKIGIVCYPSLGGSGIVATELGHELSFLGHEVHFITYEIPFRLRLEEKNIFFHEVEMQSYELFKYPDYALTLAVKIASVCKREKLDILHVHYAIPHATSAFLAKEILGTSLPKVITTLHGTDITLVGRDPSYFDMVKFSIEKSDRITAVSHSLKDETLRHFQIERPIDVIYNFFTPKEKLVHHKPLRNLYVEGEEKLLLHSSNFRPVKRVEDVVEIFAQIKKRVPAKLLLLGSGNHVPNIQKLVEKMHLQKEVIFLGKNREVDSFVASADLFLLPSAKESFGLAALEAMAYGVPVIATNQGGLPELVDQGKSGFLSDVGNTNEMAENGIHLLQNKELYQKISDHAKKRAKEHFSLEKILPQWLAIYD